LIASLFRINASGINFHAHEVVTMITKTAVSVEELIADYFAAGTVVVWDVDVLKEELVRVYRRDDPNNPVIYRRGEIADAEPAVPGWRFPVNEMFR